MPRRINALATASLIVAVPLMFVIVLCVWSLLRWLKEDESRGDALEDSRHTLEG